MGGIKYVYGGLVDGSSNSGSNCFCDWGSCSDCDRNHYQLCTNEKDDLHLEEMPKREENLRGHLSAEHRRLLNGQDEILDDLQEVSSKVEKMIIVHDTEERLKANMPNQAALLNDIHKVQVGYQELMQENMQLRAENQRLQAKVLSLSRISPRHDLSKDWEEEPNL